MTPGAYNNNVVRDPRVEIVYEDARHYVLGTPERFDIITTDPIHPWVKGSAALYTREYFEALAAHLNQSGVVALWVPLYESTLDAVRSELAVPMVARGKLAKADALSFSFLINMSAKRVGTLIRI